MIFLLVGAPGAGKGTQSELICKRFSCKSISTGDLLRKHIKNKTDIGIRAEAIMASGRLVSDDVLLQIMQVELSNLGGSAVLLDGYPRTLQQARDLHTLVGDLIAAVIHLDVELSLLVERLSGRLVCEKCAKVYHTAINSPLKAGVCDSCQGRLYTRPDDELAKIETRLRVFEEQTAPVLDFYKRNELYKRIDGSNSPEKVFCEIELVLKQSGLKENCY